jgi:hypothetical protein
VRGVARLETMRGHNFDLGTLLYLEKMQRPFNNQKRPVIERRKRRLDGVVSNQYVASQQEILWQGCGRRCSVVSSRQRCAASQDALKILDERRRRRLWCRKKLPR